MDEKPWHTVARETLGYLNFIMWPIRAYQWTVHLTKRKTPVPDASPPVSFDPNAKHIHVTIKHWKGKKPDGFMKPQKVVYYLSWTIILSEEAKVALARFDPLTPLHGLPGGTTTLEGILKENQVPSEFESEPAAIIFADALRTRIFPAIKDLMEFGASVQAQDQSFEL